MLINLRKAHGYTQENLAEMLCVSRQAVARWEAGETAPDVYILQKLCEIFGVSADSLLNGTDVKQKTTFGEFSESPTESCVPANEPAAETQESAAVTPPKSKMTKAQKILCTAAAVLAVSAAINVGIFMMAKAQILKTESSAERTEAGVMPAPRMSSLSYNSGSTFWTPEEYKEWMDKTLEEFKVMVENGESMTFHSEDGTSESHPISEEDYKSIEESLNAIYDSIKRGDLYTRDEAFEWEADDGKIYSVMTAEAYVLNDEGSYTATTIISDDLKGDEVLCFETTDTALVWGGEKRGNTFDEIFEPYKKYGLEYEEKDGERRLYFNGTTVRKFLDFSPDGGIFVFSSDGGGDIDVQTIYNDDGNLVGLKNNTEE